MLNLDVMFKEEELQKRITEMANEIDNDYNGKELLIICVLRGAVYFSTDLTKKMKTPLEIDYIRLASYEGTESTGKIKLVSDITENIEGKDVLIVEDIIDTGYTLKFLKEYLLEKKPSSLKIAVLMDKEERRIVPVNVDYVGFKIPNKYIVGYGFDIDNKYRNLNYIGSMKDV